MTYNVTLCLYIFLSIVTGSSGSVMFTDLPSGTTKVKAVNSGAVEVKEETEWFVVTV